MVRKMRYISTILATVIVVYGWYNYNKQNQVEAQEVTESIKFDRYLVSPCYINKKTSEQILNRFAYITSYNKETRTPNWVGWILTAEHTDGEYARKGHSFIEDLDVPTPRAIYSDIKEGECGYQRGHMCPAGDNKWSYKAQKESFLMTNICPQNGDLNQYDWKYLEEACREWAKKFGKIYIVAGPIYYSNKYRTVGKNRIAVPEAFFKVVLAIGKEKGQTHAIGFIYDNISGHNPLSYYARPVDYIEEITKLDFFYQLNDEIENLIEKQYDLTYWE